MGEICRNVLPVESNILTHVFALSLFLSRAEGGEGGRGEEEGGGSV